MHYFSKFFKLVNNLCVTFCAFGRKTQIAEDFEKILKVFDENSIETFNFYFIFWENLLLKIERSEITPFFYNNFSGFGGGAVSAFPLATPLSCRIRIPLLV